MSAQGRTPRRWLGRGAALVGVAFAAVLLAGGPASAGTAPTINDPLNVLDTGQVTNAAAALSDPVIVFTESGTAQAALDSSAQAKLTPEGIVIGISVPKDKTGKGYVAIRTGTKSKINQSGATQAKEAFTAAAGKLKSDGTKDVSGGTVAALQKMQEIAGKAAPPQGNKQPNQPNKAAPVSESKSWFSGIVAVLVIIGGIIVLGAILGAVTGFFRRLFGGGTPVAPAYRAPMPPPPPVYQQPPMYGGGGGVSPGAAGAMGAVAGGLIGYELGKMEGESHHHGGGGYYDNGGGYNGGGGGGDWGGGGGYDSGGGGTSDGDF